MSIQCSKPYQPVQSISIRAIEDLPGFRFISHLGSLCDDSSRATGVTEVDWLNGELSSVVTLGTMVVATVTSINAGEDVTSSVGGKAKPASGTMPVNGRALTSCTGSDYVVIKLVP